ncbi:dihydrodipicolinate synthase family protein [Thermodesulfobacteriota bacterium]
MEGFNLPRGLIVDLITPIMEDGSIDGRGLGQHLDLLLPHVQGVLVLSPIIGEGIRLSIEQKIDLFDKTLVVVRGAAPVLVWITGQSSEETIEILDSLKKQKGERKYNGPVFWVDTPLYYHSNRGLSEHYTELCSLIDESLILHNAPNLIQSLEKSLKRKNIRTSILKELVLNKKIKGLIFSGSLDRVYNYGKAVRSRSDFKIFDGDESRFLDYPGHNGVVSAGANIACMEWAKITSSSLNPEDENRYPDQQKQTWEVWSYLSYLNTAYAENSVDIIKKVLEEREIINGPVKCEDENSLTVAREIIEVSTGYKA